MKKIINAIKRFAMEKRKAFTLIELMGVLVIIGILTVILIPVINNTIKNNKEVLYNKQLDLITLSAKNLASDNPYILPEAEGEEIYITLGQLRAMGYAEETIINPKTKENFPDSLIVMVIKKGKDYDYGVIIDGTVVISSSGIIVSEPSKKYIRNGVISSYIITAKPEKKTEENKMEYYVDIAKSNIVLQGVGETDPSIKYKLDGNKGLYKLTVAGGEAEGDLYFNFKGLKNIEGKEIDVSTINSNINKIIVDNTAPTCSWSGENSTWTNNEVSIVLTGIDNYKMNSSKTTYTKAYNQSGIELSTDNLSYEIEDEAGNKNTCSKTVNVYYDKKPPTKTVVDFHGYTLDTWTNQTVNRTFSSTDGGSGVDHYEWSGDCVNFAGKENSNSVPLSGDGINTACHRAVDKVGNIGEWSNKNIVKIDKTAPVCNWNQNFNWTKNNVTVGVYGTDSGSGMSSQQSKNWEYKAANEEINTASLSYTIKDNAGNETNCSKSDVSVKHDTKAPNANCWWAASRNTTNKFSLQCTVTDASTIYTKLGYCYNANDGTKTWSCKYKSLDTRYNEYDWKSITDYYIGFNVALGRDVPSMNLKIGFKDAAGNQTGPLNMKKTA